MATASESTYRVNYSNAKSTVLTYRVNYMYSDVESTVSTYGVVRATEG